MKARSFGPIGVILLSIFYMAGAVVLLIGWVLGLKQAGQVIATAHGLAPTVGMSILPVVAALALIIAAGMFWRTRWGFFLTLAYMVYLGGVALVQGGARLAANGQPVSPVLWGNLAWAVLVIVYLMLVRRHFLGSRGDQSRGMPQNQAMAKGE